jgi:hypothetical protein
VGSQAVPFQGTAVPSGNYSASTLVALDTGAAAGTIGAATPTSLGASAASSLNDFVYNLDTTWVWVGAAGLIGLLLWKKKKR